MLKQRVRFLRKKHPFFQLDKWRLLILSSLFLLSLLVTVLPSMSLGVPVTPALYAVTPERPNLEQLVQDGTIFYETGQYTAAVNAWQQAAEAFQTNQDLVNQGMALSNLSLSYQQLGEWDKASQAITESLNLLLKPLVVHTQQTQDAYHRIIAQSWEIQGRLQLATGKAQAALESWQQATAIYEKIGDQIGISKSQINQAQAMQALGLYLRAQRTLNQVKKTLKPIKPTDSPTDPNVTTKATGLRSLGNVLRQIGELEESLEVLQKSFELAQGQAKTATMLDLGNTEQGLWKKYHDIGEKEEAEKHLREALGFYQQAATRTDSLTLKIKAHLNRLSLLLENEQWAEAETLLPAIWNSLDKLPLSRTAIFARINFAESVIKIGKNHKAAEQQEGDWLTKTAQMLATAVEQAESLKDDRAKAFALGSLGGLYEYTKQLSEAQKLTEQALLVAEKIRALDISYRWQWQLGRLLKKQAQNNEGDESMEKAIDYYNSAIATLNLVRNNLIPVSPDVQFYFRKNVEPAYREFVDLLFNDDNQEHLKKAREVIEKLQQAELIDFFRAKCFEPNPEHVDQVDSHAAIIYTIVLADRLEIILHLPQEKPSLSHYGNRIFFIQIV
ncbi:MAG: hypothetical protein F6J92_27895 [Symploca sp. SIO1A3]|nr:hypothetical protein [Symploca sp. SIO1A3]